MATEHRSPVFLLAFANEQPASTTYLRGLAQELSRLRATLEQENTPYEVVFYPNLTVEELLGSLRKYRSRIALLHYGGHSNSYSLLLQSANGQPTVADSGGFAKLLAYQRGLHLLFLNGCANAAQAEGLLEAGIAVVVATTHLIDDSVAIDFADHFYAALADDATIAEAFDQAAATVQVRKGSANRHLLFRTDATPSTAPPWQLYYRDKTAIAWRLSDVVKDPCWGLPALPRLDLPQQPFRHLAWFRRADAEIFFGRSAEIRALYDRIDDPDEAPIILLYGQSGVGKSSLLEAGLLPRLERDYLPHYVRRDREAGLAATLEAKLCARTTNRDLRTVWLAHEQRQQKPLVAILDQVEEAFTRPQPAPTATTVATSAAGTTLQSEMDHFLRTLQPLLQERSQRPRGKLILGFRKEYLAEIEDQLAAYKLPYSKVFLGPLRQAGIIEAITGVTRTPRLQKHYGLTVTAGLPALVAADLLRDPDSPLAPTLQILLSNLWESAVTQNRSQPCFDDALYQRLQDKGILLRDFFEQRWQALHAVDATAVDSGLLLDLLAFHTTPWGTAEQQGADALVQRYAHQSPARLAALVQGCKDHYLLADPVADQIDPKGTPAASRLAHDALAPLVHERFTRSEAPGQRARRLLESRLIDWPNAPQSALLNESELALVEQSRAGMRAWDTQEQALVAASRHACDERQQQAEKERAEQALIRQERAAAERRARSIQKVLLSVVAAVLVVGLVVAGVLRLRDQNYNGALTRKNAEQRASQALQVFTTDSVASLNDALEALPSEQAPKLYVAEAEFALTQALQASLERAYLPLTAKGELSAKRVAVGRDQIAVGGEHLWLLSPTFTAVMTLTPGMAIEAAAWNSTQDMLLTRDTEQISIWQGAQRRVGAAFDTLLCAAWRPHTQQISVCSGETLYLWSYPNQHQETIWAFANPIKAVQWSPSGRLAAAYTAPSAAHDQELIIWDMQTQRDLVKSAVDLTKAISDTPISDLEFVDDEHFLTWGTADVVHLWTVAGKSVQSFGVAVDDPQGFLLAPDRQHVLVFLDSGAAQLYELATGKRLYEYIGHEGRIMAAAWHDSGRYLATTGLDGTVRLWEMTTKRPLLILRGHTDGSIAGRPAVVGVAWQKDGRLLSYGEDGTLRLWALFDPQGLPLCNGLDRTRQPICHALAQSFVYSGAAIEAAGWLDNDTVVTVDDNKLVQRLTLTPTVGQAVAKTVCVGSAEFDSFSANADGQRLLFYNKEEEQDGAVCDTLTGMMIVTIPGPMTKAFWVGAQILISRPTGEAFLANGVTGEVSASLPGITTTVTAAQSSRTGQLAVATETGVIHLWQMTAASLPLPAAVILPIEKQWAVHELQWEASGRYLLATGRGIGLWDVVQKQHLWGEPGSLTNKIKAAFSADGRLVAIGADKVLQVRARDSGNILWQQEEGHMEVIHGLQWLTGARWPHQSPYAPLPTSLARWLNGDPWTMDAERPLLLTWSGDGTTKVWDWETKTEVTRMTDLAPEIGETRVAAISPDGLQILTVSNESVETGTTAVVRFWPAWHRQPAALLQAAEERLTRR